MHTWVLLTEQLQLTAVWDSNMSGTSQWCAPQPSAPLANCTQHDSLIRTQLTPCEEGGWRTHTHACMCFDVYITHSSLASADGALPQGSIQRQAGKIKKTQVLRCHQLAELVTAERQKDHLHQHGTGEDVLICCWNVFLLYSRTFI